MQVAPEVNVHTVYLDSDTKGQAGVRLDNEGGVEYCCTTDLLASNDCGPGVAVSEQTRADQAAWLDAGVCCSRHPLPQRGA